jgi:hypothetical protein
MDKKPPKVRMCSECKRSSDASTLRPLARTQHGGSVRYACPDCFERVMTFRKAVREATPFAVRHGAQCGRTRQ